MQDHNVSMQWATSLFGLVFYSVFRSVRNTDLSPKSSQNVKFIFGLSPNFGVSESLSPNFGLSQS